MLAQYKMVRRPRERSPQHFRLLKYLEITQPYTRLKIFKCFIYSTVACGKKEEYFTFGDEASHQKEN